MTGISVPADLILFPAFPLNQHGFSVDAKMSIIPLELATYRKPLAELLQGVSAVRTEDEPYL